MKLIYKLKPKIKSCGIKHRCIQKLPKECKSNKIIKKSSEILDKKHHLEDTTIITFVKKGSLSHTYYTFFFTQNSIISTSKNSVQTLEKQNITIFKTLCSIQNL